MSKPVWIDFSGDEDKANQRRMLTKAAAGDVSALTNAFVFSNTDEGHDYWADQAWHHAPLDTKRLTEMLKEFEEYANDHV